MKPIRRMIKSMTAGATAILLCVLAVMPAFADNTYVDEYDEGVPAIGAIFADEDCPLIMEYSSLTFDIGEFPHEYRNEQVASFLSYSSAAVVTTEIMITNPTNEEITATLLIPCSALPGYARYLDFEKHTENLLANISKAAIDGQEIGTSDRYTYVQNSDITSSARLLCNDLDDSGWFDPDMQVNVYRYNLNDLEGNANFCYATARFTYDPARTAVQISKGADWTATDDGYEAGIRIENGRYFEIYEYGEPSGAIEWTLYKDVLCQEEVSGNLILAEPRTYTLYELAMKEYDSDLGIEKHDWYNAVITRLGSQYDPELGVLTSAPLWNVSNNLQRWKAYEITLAPKESVTNTVTVPLYPHHYMNYEPDLYVYEYRLLSGSSEAPTVYVNTPYYMVEKDGNTYAVSDFEKTDRGYELHTGHLKGSLRFALCTEAEMKEERSPWASLLDFLLAVAIVGAVGQIILIITGIAIVLLICFGITFLIIWIVRKIIHRSRDRS